MDAQTLSKTMGGSLPLSRYQDLLPAFNRLLLAADCTTVNRAAMMTAQIGHESVGLKYAREIASGKAYEWRRDLGNVVAGDGPRFRGAGWLQVTGRGNFTAVSLWAYQKGYVSTPTYFVDNPDELASDRHVWIGPTWYWTVARPALNAAADAGQMTRATKLINGGTNGLADRQKRYDAALRLGEALLPSAVVSAVHDQPGAQVAAPEQRRRSGEDTMLHFTSPAPPVDDKGNPTIPKQQWSKILVPYAFDPIGGWGGKCVLKVDWFGRGGWLHEAQWWIRDPNWTANRPMHFPKLHPVGAGGSERFVGYGWETAPPVGADSIQITCSAPDGVLIQVVYEK